MPPIIAPGLTPFSCLPAPATMKRGAIATRIDAMVDNPIAPKVHPTITD